MAKLKIFYDQDCPVCNNYVQYLRLKDVYTSVELINVRTDKALYQTFKDQGYDLDKGMIAEVDGNLHYGAAAMRLLSLQHTGRTLKDRILKAAFISPQLAGLLYPVLTWLRICLLNIIGKDTIALSHNTGTAKHLTSFMMFSWMWSLCSLFHFSYLIFHKGTYLNGPIALSWAYAFVALFIVLFPDKRTTFKAFGALIGLQTVEMWQQMPLISNHAILISFFLAAMVCAYPLSLRHKKKASDYFYNSIAPVGRWLLVIMYIFGIFHKINTDFLNVDVSCASALWQSLPLPAFMLEHVFFHYLAIYATFIIEGLVLLGLFRAKYRRPAIVFGCFFHLFITFSSYAYYSAFSFLALTLHILFLEKESLSRFESSAVLRFIKHNTIPMRIIAILYMFLLMSFAAQKSISPLIWLFAPLGTGILVCIFAYGQKVYPSTKGAHPLKPNTLACGIGILFFINNSMPYAGLKTHQAMNMFSNLHLEDNHSNHLIVPASTQYFNYLKHTVKITRITSKGQHIAAPKDKMIWHDFLALMQDKPHYTVSFIYNGKMYENINTADLSSHIEQHVLPRFIRKYFFFTSASTHRPKTCTGFSEASLK